VYGITGNEMAMCGTIHEVLNNPDYEDDCERLAGCLTSVAGVEVSNINLFYTEFLAHKVQDVVNLPDRSFKNFMVLRTCLRLFTVVAGLAAGDGDLAIALVVCTHKWFFEHFQGVPVMRVDPEPSQFDINIYVGVVKMFIRARLFEMTTGANVLNAADRFALLPRISDSRFNFTDEVARTVMAREMQQQAQQPEAEVSTTTNGSGASRLAEDDLADVGDLDPSPVERQQQMENEMEKITTSVADISDFRSAINDLADEHMEGDIAIEGPDAAPEMFRWVMPKHALESIFNEGVPWTDDEWQKVQRGLTRYFNEVMDEGHQALQDVIEMALHPVAGVTATSTRQNDI
jgi:hypothetical protein